MKLVDPKMGEYLHSKDTRRVINALFKYFKYLFSPDTSLRESDIQSTGASALKLRYYPILIWMRASPEILEQRITKRIDEMLFK